MRSKDRDKLYGVKPRNVEMKREELPQSPAKKPAGYCKRLKGEHIFALTDVKVYKHRSYLQGYPGPIFITGYTNYKEYRCDGCSKKKIEREEWKLDEPVRERWVA